MLPFFELNGTTLKRNCKFSTYRWTVSWCISLLLAVVYFIILGHRARIASTHVVRGVRFIS